MSMLVFQIQKPLFNFETDAEKQLVALATFQRVELKFE